MQDVLNIEDIRKSARKYGKQYGAERIYLFGSYARGEATKDSDVDLRVDRGTIRGFAMGGLLNDIEETLGKKVDLLSTGALRKDFLEEIKKEEILLYEQQG